MTTPDWVQDAIFYQIFPDRFAKSTRNPSAIFPLKHGILPPHHMDLRAATYMGSPKSWII